MSTNHAILLTAPGSGAIAVVRLSGESVGRFLERHFTRQAKIGRCVHGQLRDESGRVLDDPVVARLADSTADINLHGSPWIVRQVMELAKRQGFAVIEASAGPLHPEAVDIRQTAGDAGACSSNMQHIMQEVLTCLPLANTELAVRALLSQVEAWERWETLGPVHKEREARMMLADRALWWLLHPPRVAIVGRANVGKSTLANQLFAQERSIVADQPGTTRDWVGELANVNDLAVMLVDTPGRRITDDPIEAEAIRQSANAIAGADLVIEVLDASAAGDDDAVMAPVPSEHVVRVANKQDRRVWDVPAAMPLTATTGQGMDKLRLAITRHFGCNQLDLNRPRWWTERQRALLQDQALALHDVDS